STRSSSVAKHESDERAQRARARRRAPSPRRARGRRAPLRPGHPALARTARGNPHGGVQVKYIGMEVGDTTETGAPALFYRRPVFWEIGERRPEFPRFYQQMIALRRAHASLRGGELVWLHNSDESRVLSYLRRGAGEELVVAVNFSTQPFVGTVEAPAGATFTDITPDTPEPLKPDAPPSERAAHARTSGLPALALDSWGYRIFRRQK